MKRASITIPDDLESAPWSDIVGTSKFRRALRSVVQVALERFLKERGYLVEPGEVFEDDEEIILPTGPKPGGILNAPKPKGGGNPVSDAVIEDRR